jgi:hypothetical protein
LDHRLNKAAATLSFALILILCFCVAAYTQAAAAVKKVYVEPFTTRTFYTELRDAVIAELRKSKAVAVVASSTSADLI